MENNKKLDLPTNEELKHLYEAAVEFKKAACWKWMHDHDIFAVVSPETQEIAYCCVLGNGGEHFGLVGYLGFEGFSYLSQLLRGEVEFFDSDFMFLQKCLMASFEDRGGLEKEELKVIKDLQLKFRGRNQWPVFRSYEPGKLPWSLNAGQCRFLTHILTQSLDVSLRCKKGRGILDEAKPGTLLMRVWSAENGEGEWSDQYMPVEKFAPLYTTFHLEDEIRLQKIKRMTVNSKFNLEADTSYLPSPLKAEGERPFFPKICIFVDHQNGAVHSAEIIQDIPSEGYKCLNNFLQLIEQKNIKPAKVFVQREETYYLLNNLCDRIGIKLEQVEYLPFTEDFLEEMFEGLNPF